MVAPIPNDIFQFSTYAAYQAGFNQGQPRVGDLFSHGTDGIGAAENGMLMTLFDSEAYLTNDDGKLIPAPQETRLPFAMVTNFRPMLTVRPLLPCMRSLEELVSLASSEICHNEWIGGPNSLMPFQIQAEFTSITLATGAGNRNVKRYERVKGTLIGYVVPVWMAAISGSRIHCHFLSEGAVVECGAMVGGRVIEWETAGEAVVALVKCGRFHLGFPHSHEWESLPFS
jgi:alpha-acetolactate decarboxylase